MNLSDEERQRRADRMRGVAAKGRAAKAARAAETQEAVEAGYMRACENMIDPPGIGVSDPAPEDRATPVLPPFPWDGEKDEQKAKELFDVWVEETKTVMPAILPAMREVIAKQKATKKVSFDVARYLRLKAFYAKKKAASS